MDSKGYVQIGYIYTFLLSALLLATLTYTTSGLVTETARYSERAQLKDVAGRIANGIEEVATIAKNHPNATYERYVKVPAPTEFSEYHIEVSNEVVYINATGGVHVRKSFHNTGDIMVYGKSAGSAGKLTIKYERIGNEKVISIK